MFAWVGALLSSSQARRRSKNFDPNHTLALLRLPQELLDLVVEFLDISEAACLSVCCRYLYRRLGTNRYPLLRKDQGHEDQRKQFLLCLARDNPALFFCHSCSRLHPVSSVGLPLVGRGGPRLRCMWWGLAPVDDVPFHSFEWYGDCQSYRLRFPHVQLVMARHRDGSKYGLPTSTLSITEVRRVKRHKVWCVLNVEPRIVDDELFLRVQQWVAFDQDEQPNFQTLRCPSVCYHISNSVITHHEFTVSNMLRCQIQHLGRRASCPTCCVPHQCDDCAVEFEANAVRLDDRKVAVIITKWMNLGGGVSPFDPMWRRHLIRPSDERPAATASNSLGPRKVFEGQSGRSHEAAARAIVKLLGAKSLDTELHLITCNTLHDIWRDKSLIL